MVLVVCLKETYWSRPVRKAGEKKKEGGKRAPKKIRPQKFFEKRGRSEIKKIRQKEGAKEKSQKMRVNPAVEAKYAEKCS